MIRSAALLALFLIASPSHLVQAQPPPGPEVNAFKEAQEAVLAKYGVKAKSQYLKLKQPQTTVHVLEAGQGKPLLLIHGGRSCACSFAPLLAALQNDFHLYAFDRPGHGTFQLRSELNNLRPATLFVCPFFDL